uniref:Uncharacterized protein LOC102804652 n=1 Tax=Saccoglossus kowalevskii TaxID=10224 RepID=A0ABM0M0J0_SACKO|nr:PREDICTED: uncharacterized protein LOC102804652 [Saccoglossus kowalevskii]
MSPFIPENNSAETTLESDLVVNRTLPVEVVTLTPNITTYQMIHSTASVALLASISCGVIVICLLAMCAIWRWKLITRLKSMQTTGLNEETQILKCTNPPVRTDNTNNDASLLQTTYRAEEVPRSLTSDSLQSTASAADAEEGTSQPIQHSEVRRHSMTAFRFHHDLIGELDPSLYKNHQDNAVATGPGVVNHLIDALYMGLHMGKT